MTNVVEVVVDAAEAGATFRTAGGTVETGVTTCGSSRVRDVASQWKNRWGNRHFSPIPTAVQGSEQTCTGAYRRGIAGFSDEFHGLDESQIPYGKPPSVTPIRHPSNST